MKTLIAVLIAVVCVSCGPDVNCEVEIAGACFDGNGWDWHADMVNLTFDYVEAAVSEYYCLDNCDTKVESDLRLRELAENEGLEVQFRGYLSLEDCDIAEDDSATCLGEYWNDFAYIRVAKSQMTELESKYADWINCYRDYFVLGHELLHFVGDRWLDLENRSNQHNIPHFWSMHASEGERVIENTLEKDVFQACKYYFSRVE